MNLRFFLMAFISLALACAFTGCGSDEPESSATVDVLKVNGKKYYSNFIEGFTLEDDQTIVNIWLLSKNQFKNKEEKYNIPFFSLTLVYEGDITQLKPGDKISTLLGPSKLVVGDAIMGDSYQHIEFNDLKGTLELAEVSPETVTLKFTDYSFYAIPALDKNKKKAQTYKLNGTLKITKRENQE